MNLLSFINQAVSGSIDSGGRYLESKKEYYELLVFLKASKVLTRIVKSILIAIIVFFGTLMVSIDGAVWLGEYLNNPALAYFLIGVFFFCLIPVLKLIKKKIEAVVIKGFYKDVYDKLVD